MNNCHSPCERNDKLVVYKNGQIAKERVEQKNK